MHLITALAAGVRGAESGSAFLYRRGTSTLVSYYGDFEATNPLQQSSTGIPLDSHGGAVAYVDGMVKVVVKNSSGAVVRTFVAGVKDAATEVISTGFTGTDYVTGASGASKPTTLQSVLDKWKTSAGTTDFKVLVDGTATNLQTAVQGQLSGFFYNVKSADYGAVGDGVVDDFASVQAAIDDAAVSGGVVVLPPGEYRFTEMVEVPKDVSIIGAGPECTAIVLDADTASTYSAFYFPGSSSLHYRFQSLSGVRILCTQVNTREAVRIKDAFLIVHNCLLIGSPSGFTDELIAAPIASTPASYHVVIDTCSFSLDDQPAVVMDEASTSGAVYINNCKFVATDTSYSVDMVVVDGPDTDLKLLNSVFDVTSATGTNTGTMVLCEGVMDVRGCELHGPSNGAASLIGFSTVSATDGFVTESGNVVFGAGSQLYEDSPSSAVLDRVMLSSRNERYKRTPTTAATESLNPLEYGTILIDRSSGAALTVNCSPQDLPAGAKFRLSIWNQTGGALTVTLGTGFKGTNLTVADNRMQTADFVSLLGSGTAYHLYQVGTPRDEVE